MEFDQNGSVRTKYGTKDEYLDAINASKENGIKPIADIVLNHKANGDKKETFTVMKMDPENRQQPISEPYEIEGYTHFNFPGCNKKYNDLNGIGIISQGSIMMRVMTRQVSSKSKVRIKVGPTMKMLMAKKGISTF